MRSTPATVARHPGRHFRTIATYNPVSYLIEGIRSLFIDGFDAEALALAFGSAIAIASIFLALAVTTLRTTLVRT